VESAPELPSPDERAVIEKILRTSAAGLRSAGHLGLPIEAPAPARQAEWLAGFDPAADEIPG
jgi:hypothetical protein